MRALRRRSEAEGRSFAGVGGVVPLFGAGDGDSGACGDLGCVFVGFSVLAMRPVCVKLLHCVQVDARRETRRGNWRAFEV